MAEQVQFYPPRSNRRQAVRLDKQSIDDIEVVHAYEVQGQTIIDPTEVVRQMQYLLRMRWLMRWSR